MQESHELPHHTPGSSIASLALVVLAFLLPLFFIPNAVFPFELSKTLLSLVVVVIILIAFSVKTLRSGTLSIPWSWLSFSILILPLAYLISSVFSSVPSLSFFGYELDQDTFGFIALCAALSFATAFAATSKERIWRTLFALLIGGWVVILFQFVQILFNVPINFGIFSAPTNNLLGKWNDVGLLISLVASLSLLSFETLSLSKTRKIVLGMTFLASLILMVFINFPLAWYLLGLVSFMTVVFVFMRHVAWKGEGGVGRGIASCIVLAVTVFVAFFGSGLTTSLQDHYNISSLEVSPSFQGTLSIIEGVYAKDPFFGSGPDTFSNDWLLYRPVSTVSTAFWSTEFGSGFAYIPSALATGGIVVGIAWLLLIVFFLLVAVRALFSVSSGTGHAYFLVVATALGSAFLLAAHLFYTPSPPLTLLLFIFFGLFIASLRGTPFVRTVSVTFSNSPRLAFVCVVAIAAVLVMSLVSLYGAGEVYASSVIEGKASLRSTANDIPGAISEANEAVSLLAQDRYYRALTNLELAQISTILQSGASDPKTQSNFQNALSQAITFSADAIALDPSYDNWMTRASIYESVVPLNITGASDNAVAALESARKVNPASPEVDYQEATLKAYAKDDLGAKAAAQASLAKKADYTPAIFLLAQIALNEGDLSDAITSLKSALVFTPNDSSLLYEIGVLDLEAKNYTDAADAFTQALVITPDYANATFFLGEADVFLGQDTTALSLFQSLEVKNPNNATLTAVITKLQSGQNPFAEAPTTLPPETTPSIAQ